ncbi:MAG: thioredoxin family protein [Leadbetterella sp.]|nr:thioredoxin family protein [Leadbetterella sp.]
MKPLAIKILLAFMLNGALWGENLETAQADAKQNHKLILLYFSGSDWCGPCIKLKQEVLETAEFQDFAKEHLNLVRADFPRMKKNQLSKEQTAYNEKLAEKYNPKGKFPLTVLINPDGKVITEWDGYPKDLNTQSLKKQILSHF